MTGAQGTKCPLLGVFDIGTCTSTCIEMFYCETASVMWDE